MAEHHGTVATLGRLLKEIEAVLKEPQMGMELGSRGVNTSITLLAVQGVGAYIEGNSRQASEDLATAAEEMKARSERR